MPEVGELLLGAHVAALVVLLVFRADVLVPQRLDLVLREAAVLYTLLHKGERGHLILVRHAGL